MEQKLFFQQFCHSRGKHLVEIWDSTKSLEVTKYLNKIDSGSDKMFWIGLTDQLAKGKYVWNYSNVSMTFSDWLPDEPKSSSDHHCAITCFKNCDGNGYLRSWRLDSCSTKIFALCETGEFDLHSNIDAHRGVGKKRMKQSPPQAKKKIANKIVI